YNIKVNKTITIYRAFSHFLPEGIIDDLIHKDSEKELMTGEKRSIVVIFCHIKQFGKILEHNDPQAIVNFLNAHFTNMVTIIQSHGGIIDKFIGDAVFAIFGAPISYKDNALRAANASVEMIKKFKNIDTNKVKFTKEGFSIGIGINEGDAIIGNIGCSDKFDYTAIGDTVNLAARLESLTKHYKRNILISENINKKIDKLHFTRMVDTAKVKGKNQSTNIFSLEINPVPFTKDWADAYQKGLKMYHIGNWFTAREYFQIASEINPDDFPTIQYQQRCNMFIEAPPDNWEGAVTLDFK
ncbi:MAG: adenylate/guanylate cyclase domain-containing protein, partial [Spirochaetota bacterium]|nr:adenylate/guanylate cyclase domain-containing protein [Spirochaetota bacterium]